MRVPEKVSDGLHVSCSTFSKRIDLGKAKSHSTSHNSSTNSRHNARTLVHRPRGLCSPQSHGTHARVQAAARPIPLKTVAVHDAGGFPTTCHSCGTMLRAPAGGGVTGAVKQVMREPLKRGRARACKVGWDAPRFIWALNGLREMKAAVTRRTLSSE